MTDRTDIDDTETPDAVELSDAELIKRRRKRSIVLALTLAAMVVMFYVLTLVKLGPRVFDRPL